MQGGGVAVYGSANFNGCNIFNNEVTGAAVRARIFDLLDPSSSAPLNSDTFALFLHAACWCSHLNPLEPSSSAPMNFDILRCFSTQDVGARI